MFSANNTYGSNLLCLDISFDKSFGCLRKEITHVSLLHPYVQHSGIAAVSAVSIPLKCKHEGFLSIRFVFFF